MKKILAFLFVLTIGSLTSSQLKAQGFGVGLAIGTGLEDWEGGSGIGIGLLGSYSAPINTKIRYAVDLAFYLPSSGDFDIDFLGTKVKVSSTIMQFEVNGNAHYIFNTTETMEIYGIGGLQFAYKSVTVDVSGADSVSESDNAIGINLGAGANFNVAGKKLFAELKYTVGGFGQLQIATGIRF